MTVEFPPSAVQRSLLVEPAETRAHQPGPGAKQRVLTTSDRLFYDEGIRTVGVDRLISESSVTKATFYKHFGAKDNLVVDYIGRRHASAVAEVEAIAAREPDATGVIRGVIASITADIQRPEFRGCPFVNAAAEFANSSHPVRQVVLQHREWFTDTLVELFRDAGHPLSGDAADEFLLARDGAMVGGYAGDPIAATAALSRVAERLLADCV
ncbi:TetR/AcrR family transcriptional regulator [Frondihabitans sp. 4ASC-45]|uniref:TetR/AcrR family transcriptional regulator n=1 Tax=Frondihabitans sp. 4ASC-45 TaxID=3111636 RepID=UPI003C1A2865